MSTVIVTNLIVTHAPTRSHISCRPHRLSSSRPGPRCTGRKCTAVNALNQQHGTGPTVSGPEHTASLNTSTETSTSCDADGGISVKGRRRQRSTTGLGRPRKPRTPCADVVAALVSTANISQKLAECIVSARGATGISADPEELCQRVQLLQQLLGQQNANLALQRFPNLTTYRCVTGSAQLLLPTWFPWTASDCCFVQEGCTNGVQLMLTDMLRSETPFYLPAFMFLPTPTAVCCMIVCCCCPHLQPSHAGPQLQAVAAVLWGTINLSHHQPCGCAAAAATPAGPAEEALQSPSAAVCGC